MTNTEFKELIEMHGKGKNISQKVKDVAERTRIAEPTIWRYLRGGIPTKTPATMRLAFEVLASKKR